MKVCIVGAGAIGGLAGALFARAGHEVSLIARGAHLEALRARGLTLESGGCRESFHLAAAPDPCGFGVQDLVLISLKAYSVPQMLGRVRSLVGPDTVVLPAINGLPWWYFYREGGRFDGQSIACLDPEREMYAALDPSCLVGCVVHAAAEVVEPGVIRHTTGRRFVLGEPDGSDSDRLRRVAGAMGQAGFEVCATPRIRDEIWMKLIGNLSYNPVAALTLARMDEINCNPGLLDIIRVAMQEAMRVARAYGVNITMSVEDRIEIARDIGNAKISMHQDVERGRPLEIDAIVGSVIELAHRAGVSTPMTAALHALITERARHLHPAGAVQGAQ